MPVPVRLRREQRSGGHPDARPCGGATQQSVLPGATLEAAEEEPEEDVNEDLEKAMGFLEKDVADLIAVFGEPNSSDYGPSCLGSGEDGELHYDAFTVYTYREGESEIVKDVE